MAQCPRASSTHTGALLRGHRLGHSLRGWPGGTQLTLSSVPRASCSACPAPISLMSRRLSSRRPEGEGISGQSSSSMAVLSRDGLHVANDPSHPTSRPTAAVSGFSSGRCACAPQFESSLLGRRPG